ncbi:unnamed protein product [Haemonchus placei]|uniref:Uncharacterized protein n=1 Tax=Haemonchus placei TaxID=6290 RepID=A0A0N4W5V3_HAEPC|nr:unnamed protein product [Haemonchus placei]
MDSTYRGPRVGVLWRARGFLLGQPCSGVLRWLRSGGVRGSCALEAIALERCIPQDLEMQPASRRMAFVFMPFAAISPCIGRFSQEQQELRERDIDLPICKRRGRDMILCTCSCRAIAVVFLIQSWRSMALRM